MKTTKVWNYKHCFNVPEAVSMANELPEAERLSAYIVPVAAGNIRAMLVYLQEVPLKDDNEKGITDSTGSHS